ncbi:MAG: imidazole glycerol phosphate synthase subunit HisH [Cyanobacteria bacterium P01_F01_bin.150]
MVSIAVIDYDMGNLHSVCKGLEYAGAVPTIVDTFAEMNAADAVILPGVGSFDPAMRHLRSRDLIHPIQDIVANDKPFLGICLGLQILLEGSEEGEEPGLGIVPGRVRRFQPESGITIPQMGWNQLQFAQTELAIWADLPLNPWLYFVHSFYADPANASDIAATVSHGSQTVTAAIARNNLVAAQFHPEKSSATGLKILSNFVRSVEQSQCIPELVA